MIDWGLLCPLLSVAAGVGALLWLWGPWCPRLEVCRVCGRDSAELPEDRDWAEVGMCADCYAAELHRELGEQSKGGPPP